MQFPDHVQNYINTTGANSGTGTAHPSGAPEFIPGFQWSLCYSIFSFISMFCRSLFVLSTFFFWSLCCLFFIDLLILISSLVSSNSSYAQTTMNSAKIKYAMAILKSKLRTNIVEKLESSIRHSSGRNKHRQLQISSWVHQ